MLKLPPSRFQSLGVACVRWWVLCCPWRGRLNLVLFCSLLVNSEIDLLTGSAGPCGFSSLQHRSRVQHRPQPRHPPLCPGQACHLSQSSLSPLVVSYSACTPSHTLSLARPSELYTDISTVVLFCVSRILFSTMFKIHRCFFAVTFLNALRWYGFQALLYEHAPGAHTPTLLWMHVE